MEIYNLRRFTALVADLQLYIDICQGAFDADKTAVAGEKDLAKIAELFNNAYEVAAELKWRDSRHIRTMMIELPDYKEYASLRVHLRDCFNLLIKNAFEQKFALIELSLSEYTESAATFGEQINKAFPSAVGDIKEAGNCLAVGCFTAAIFHLMRVAEYGLRALARDRRLTIPKKMPIELATWEDIIKQLEKTEEAIQGYPKTLAREKQFEFYHGAMMEFKRFKNVFRNRVAHTREDYDGEQTRSAYAHVKAFMQILASRIAENKRTPMIWKRL